MAKLMRAEWYRLRHSSSYFRVFVIFCLCIVAMTFQDINCLSLTINENLPSIFNSAASGISMFIGTVTAAAVGSFYSNRTGYYEIMDGNSTVSIIMSKVCVYTLAAFGFYLVPQLILITIMGVKNGAGDTQNLALLLVLAIIILVHIISTIVLHSLLFRNKAAAIFPYARFMIFELMGSTLFPILAKQIFSLSDETTDKFANLFTWLPAVQLTMLSGNIDTTFIAKVVISFVVEFAVMFALVYKSFKRKNFKN